MNIKTSKWLCTLLCALLLCAMIMPTYALELDENKSTNGAVISTVVPSSHTLTVTTDGAIVYVDNSEVENGATQLERQSTPKLLISAESGKKLQSVTLDGKDITAELKSGSYTLSKVITDRTLIVTTVNETPTSTVTYTVTGTVKQNGKSISGIKLELRSKLKTTVTDSDGTFGFKKVESGHHSLTALKDGKVIGYAEFTLSGGSAVLDFTIADNGTVDISVPDNTAVINLELNLTEDGLLQIEDVQATKHTKSDGNSPQTGDNSNIWLWSALFLVSGGTLIILGVTKKRKKVK